MNEYELLGRLHNIIENYTVGRMREWIDLHNMNYYFLYPNKDYRSKSCTERRVLVVMHKELCYNLKRE